MVKPILFTAALLSVCAAANPLAKNDNGNNGNGNGNGNNGNGNNGNNGNGNGKGNNGKGNKSSSTTSSSISMSASTSSSSSQAPSSTSSSSTLILSSSTSTSSSSSSTSSSSSSTSSSSSSTSSNSSSTSSSSTSTSSSSTSISPAPISTSTSLAPVETSASSGDCFDATIRKEYLLQITTYQPYDPFKSDVDNVNQVRLHIADATNQNQDAITCTTARWNSTSEPFPSDYLTCDDPTISYKLTSWTDNSTFSLITNQTFVQGSFTENVLASYNATKSDLNGYACYANQGCSAYYQNGGQGHAVVYDVQKTGPPSTTFPAQCPPGPLPHPSSYPVRYISYAPENPADTSQPVARYISMDLLTDATQNRRVKCTGPAWDPTTSAAQPADWYPCPYISYIPGNWSFRVESYTDYHTFNLGIKQHICNEVQCQDNLIYANMSTATEDYTNTACLGGNKCTAGSGFIPVTAPVYAVANLTVIE